MASHAVSKKKAADDLTPLLPPLAASLPPPSHGLTNGAPVEPTTSSAMKTKLATFETGCESSKSRRAMRLEVKTV